MTLQVISLTDNAIARIRDIIAGSAKSDQCPAIGLKVGLKKGGCAGVEYTIEKVFKTNDQDEMVECQGVRVFIDNTAVLFLLGSEMDYHADKLKAGFVFNNPNEVSACGCGESVELKPKELQELVSHTRG